MQQGSRRENRGSKIVSQGAPFLIFGSREDQVEGLSVSRRDIYGVELAVRKYNFPIRKLYPAQTF
jgi:hypothetical protein